MNELRFHLDRNCFNDARNITSIVSIDDPLDLFQIAPRYHSIRKQLAPQKHNRMFIAGDEIVMLKVDVVKIDVACQIMVDLDEISHQVDSKVDKELSYIFTTFTRRKSQFCCHSFYF
jgi:hypothetical protein